MDAVINKTKEKMEKALGVFQQELSRLRTGRASLALLDDVRVDYYGQALPLNQVATLGVPEARLITVAPWEGRIIPDIERAIDKANLGLSPVNDGKLIRIPIPPLTEERRKDLTKQLRTRAEEARVSMRHARREGMDEVKKLEKEGTLTEDDSKKAAAQIQKLTDDWATRVDEAAARKEKEILQV